MGLPRVGSEAVPVRGPDAGLFVPPVSQPLRDLGVSVVWVGGFLVPKVLLPLRAEQ